MVLKLTNNSFVNSEKFLSWKILVYAEVTYPGIGTFTTKDFFDIVHRPIVLLPQSPEHINTRFLLHTRKNLNEHQILKVHDHDSIKNSLFNGKNPTKFIIHGFIDNQLFGDWMRKMKDEFLIAGDYNVIIVDWSGGNGDLLFLNISFYS